MQNLILLSWRANVFPDFWCLSLGLFALNGFALKHICEYSVLALCRFSHSFRICMLELHMLDGIRYSYVCTMIFA